MVRFFTRPSITVGGEPVGIARAGCTKNAWAWACVAIAFDDCHYASGGIAAYPVREGSKNAEANHTDQWCK